MKKVETGALARALQLLVTAAQSITSDLLPELAPRFCAQMQQAVRELEEAIRLLDADDLVKGFFAMKPGWEHLVEAVCPLEESFRWVRPLAQVEEVCRRLAVLGKELDAVIAAIATPGDTWTLGEQMFVEVRLLGPVEERVYFTSYTYNPPSHSTIIFNDHGEIVEVRHEE